MYSFVLVVHILLAILMIALILVQHGKGADAGASFGGGGAATVFGASGSGNFMTRLTAILTALFFVTSLTLAVYAKKQTQGVNVLPGTEQVEQAPAPLSNTTPAPATTMQTPTTSQAPGTSSNTPINP
uniref:preprotein translocase subunit SecG n=1 Tax=uncultured Acinetobacter sp. TaxID=165433 RepID=UPI002627D856|nr:preprotein translocase subunit SecG [uncultured Acinetobacter sp.]